MDHAARVIERLVIDRETRMLGLAEHCHQLCDGNRLFHGDDVGPRHHDVLDRELAEAEDVEKHGALLCAEGVVARLAASERVLDHLAQVRLLAKPEAREQSLEPRRLLFRARIVRRRQLALGERGVAHGVTSAAAA